MNVLLSYSAPFPSLSWYLYLLQQGVNHVEIDLLNGYRKMSYRNRYYVTGAQGRQLLSIPLEQGRNQRIPMKDVRTDNAVNWQLQHWRTLETNYRSTPFYEYTAPLFEPLFTRKFTFLHDFNYESIQIIQSLLKLPVTFRQSKTVPGGLSGNITDIRNTFSHRAPAGNIELPEYHQVFGTRCGFQQDLSVLDYIFNEGVRLQK